MIRGLLFDLNGTLIDIRTDEGDDNVYRVVANLLDYRGIRIPEMTLKQAYFDLMRRQKRESLEPHPEFDAVRLFADLLRQEAGAAFRALPAAERRQLPGQLAECYRAASRFRLELYPGVRETLEALRGRYALAAVSDGQRRWAMPELRSVGLEGWFDPVIISSDLGFRKPDPRMFELALAALGLEPEEVLFVGNDRYRDIFGAHRLGIRTVFFPTNQGDRQPHGVEPDYIIYRFPELPEAIRFFG